MIVLFIKSDLIRRQPIPGCPCPNCGKSDALAMELRQRYAEFATMVVYPKGVFGVVHCRHCGYTLPASRWTDDLHRAFVAMKIGYKTPRTYWQGAIRASAGFVVGTVLLVSVLGFMGQHQRAGTETQQAAFDSALHHPVPGITLASITNGNSTYNVWRVDRVKGDTIWLKKYTGRRTMTDFYSETGWSTLPNTDFSGEGIAYSNEKYADKGLKRIEELADKTKPYEGVILAVLTK